LIEEVDPQKIPELSDSWEKLDLKAQNSIRRTLGNLEEAFQNLEILARLSERLGLHIVEQTAHPAHIKE
jgi:hypothetical protein